MFAGSRIARLIVSMAVKQQLLLTPGARALTDATVESWIEGAVRGAADPRVRELFFDLRAVNQCEPYALAVLQCLLRFLAGHEKSSFLILPEDERLLADLYRFRFSEAMQPYTASTLQIALGPRDTPETQVVLPLTGVGGPEDAARVLEGMAAARERAMAHLGFDAGDVARLEAAVMELCRNVWDHSGDVGVVAIQLARQPRTERPLVQVGVADQGIGLKGSLASRYDVAAWSDAEAILQAVRPGVSRIDSRRGIGLTQALETARRYDGTLLIRSGTARVQLPDRRSWTGSLFPGTQIALELKGKR
jgi:anti-sigma regulatory factor (Ser/Thr protein kinase)